MLTSFTLNDDGFPAGAGPCALTGGPINIASDTQPPTITCPPNAVVPCNNIPPAAGSVADFIAAGGTATDNCTIASIAVAGSSVGDVCPSTAQQVLMYMYTLTDDSGNPANCTQTITVQNSTVGPVITSVPPNHTINCSYNAMPQLNLFNASSDCGLGLTLSVSGATNNGTPNCPGATIQYTYTAMDACGRTATHIQTYTIQNDGPEFVCPAEICIIECPENTADIQTQFDAYAGLATVNTSCNGSISVSNNFNPNGFFNQNCGTFPLNGVPNVRRWQNVTFTATDQCGRTSFCTALVVIVDNTPPVITGNLEVTIRECDDIVQSQYDKWINDVLNNVLSATDACGTVTWSYTPNSPTIECNEYGYAITEVVFTATDQCGNASSVETHFKLKNSIGPTISLLDDKTIECDETPVFDTPTVTNACGGFVLTFEDETIPGDCPQEMTLIRTWTATDECDGVSTRSQTINVVDTTAPAAPAPPADVNVQCAADVPPPVDLTAQDNCAGPITVSPSAVITPGDCENQFTMVRTWTFVDPCGNSSSVSQTINVNDTTPPDAPAPPADVNVQCAADVPPPVNLTANDNCDGDITVSPSAVITPGDCENQFTMVRTWTFVDDCGNSSSVSQTINVNDTTPPDAPAPPADVNVQCAEDVPPPVNLTANDNCDGDITVSPSAVITPGDCEDQFTMVRTWTFVDDCGNSSSVSQTITVNDDTPPNFTFVPADITDPINCQNDDGSFSTCSQISKGTDDAEENEDGEVNLTSSDLELILDNSNGHRAGSRTSFQESLYSSGSYHHECLYSVLGRCDH